MRYFVKLTSLLFCGWRPLSSLNVSFFDTMRVRPKIFACFVFAFLTISILSQVGKTATETGLAVEKNAEWSATSTNDLYIIRISPQGGRPLIGEFQVWDLLLTTPSGAPIFPARFAIGGGMLGHGHGLPTQPRVTSVVKEGHYLIDGLKFNMAGAWTLYFTVEIPAGDSGNITTDQARIDVQIDY